MQLEKNKSCTFSEKVQDKILNIAWVGQGDFGDEAMAFVLRKFLKNQGFDSITYYQHGKYPTYRDKNDLKTCSIHSFKRSQKLRKVLDKIRLKNYKACIIGGGSILHRQGSIGWKKDILEQLKKHNPNLVSACLGVSLGPFKTDQDEKTAQEFLDRIDLGIFRDQTSFNLARELSQNKNLYSSLDSALLLKELCPEQMPQKHQPKKDQIGVILVKNKHYQDNFNQNQYFERYLALINHILKKSKKVVLFNFYVGPAYLDQELNQSLKRHSQDPDRVEIKTYQGDIFKTINQINQCESIISMRLHGIVLAYLLGIPFVSLEYDPKNQNFCDSVDYPQELSFNMDELENIQPACNAIDLIFGKKNQVFEKTMPQEQAIELVKKNFDLLGKKL